MWSNRHGEVGVRFRPEWSPCKSVIKMSNTTLRPKRRRQSRQRGRWWWLTSCLLGTSHYDWLVMMFWWWFGRLDRWYRCVVDESGDVVDGWWLVVDDGGKKFVAKRWEYVGYIRNCWFTRNKAVEGGGGASDYSLFDMLESRRLFQTLGVGENRCRNLEFRRELKIMTNQNSEI